ncbi:hypothetical protein L1049_013552 [Liquidambar formosana]|uniref:Uncharacterized protein n=1 Tax=Liquidambar formosana TaxID=63359 RepID=A0AAP0RL02_LIQFO
MANGTDSEEFVVLSKVRPGLKRELAWALKLQSQISGSPGRTRASKAQNGSLGNGGSEKPSKKRLKRLWFGGGGEQCGKRFDCGPNR